MILSRVNAPDRSPSAIIRAAGRSLTEPPGFFHSAFAYSSTLRRPASKRGRRIKGVFPIRSTIEMAVRGSPGIATGISDCSSPRLSAPNAQLHNSQMKSLGRLGVGNWELGVGSWRFLTDWLPLRIADFNGAQIQLPKLGFNFRPVAHGDDNELVRHQVLLGDGQRL